jgi:hypothetical protein
VQLATSHACRGIDIVLLCTHKHRYVMRAPGSFTAAIRAKESASPAKYKPKRPTPNGGLTGTKRCCSRFFSRVVGYAEKKHVKQFEACTSRRGRVSGLASVFFLDAGAGSHLRALRSGW